MLFALDSARPAFPNLMAMAFAAPLHTLILACWTFLLVKNQTGIYTALLIRALDDINQL